MPTPDVEDDYSTRVSPSDAVAAATAAAAQAAEEVDGQPMSLALTPTRQNQRAELDPVTPTSPLPTPHTRPSAAHHVHQQVPGALAGSAESHQGPPGASDQAVVFPPSFITGAPSFRVEEAAQAAPAATGAVSSDGSRSVDSSRPLLPPVEPRGLTASQRDALANT